MNTQRGARLLALSNGSPRRGTWRDDPSALGLALLGAVALLGCATGASERSDRAESPRGGEQAPECVDLAWEQGPTSVLLEAALLPAARSVSIQRCIAPDGGPEEWRWQWGGGQYSLSIFREAFGPHSEPALTSEVLRVTPASTAGLDTARLPFLACPTFSARWAHTMSVEVARSGDELSIRLSDERIALAFAPPSARDLHAIAPLGGCGAALEMPSRSASCHGLGIVACQRCFSGALGEDELRCFDPQGVAVARFPARRAEAITGCHPDTILEWAQSYDAPCTWKESPGSFRGSPILGVLDFSRLPKEVCFNIDRTVARFEVDGAQHTYTTAVHTGGGNSRGTRWTLEVSPPSRAVFDLARYPFLRCNAHSASSYCAWNVALSSTANTLSLAMDDIHPPCAVTDWGAALAQLRGAPTRCGEDQGQ
jgi:hypothetical protein